MQLALASPRTHASAEWTCLLLLQQLSSTLLHPCDAGKELRNQNKNRYNSIIPCKQSSPGVGTGTWRWLGSTGFWSGVGTTPAHQQS